MNKKLYYQIFGAIIGVVGCVIIYIENPFVMVGVFLLIWSNNISLRWGSNG